MWPADPDRGQFTGALQRGIDVSEASVHSLGQRPVTSVGEHRDAAVAVDSEPVELAAPQRVVSRQFAHARSVAQSALAGKPFTGRPLLHGAGRAVTDETPSATSDSHRSERST
jgi:hypothetical protein